MDPADQQCCYTIGYGNLPFGAFLSLLNGAGVRVIVDARSIPYSRFNPPFRKPALRGLLEEQGISYQYLGDRIGGRYKDPDLLLPDGSVDYRKVRETERFRTGIDSLVSLLSQGRTAILCAEADPTRCHRFRLIAPALRERGIQVIHLLPGGMRVSNEDIRGDPEGKWYQAPLSDRWETDSP